MKHTLFIILFLSFFQAISQEKRGTIKVVKLKQDIIKTEKLHLTDTLFLDSGVFVIRLSEGYKSKLRPMLLNNQLVLVDKQNQLSDNFIVGFTYSTSVSGTFIEFKSNTNNFSFLINNGYFSNSKVGSRIWVSSIKGSSTGGVTINNIIDVFVLEKIK